MEDPMKNDNEFFDTVLGRSVDVYLVNGIRLSGRFANHLPFAVVLEDGHHSGPLLVYKHAIATVVETRLKSS